MPLEEFITLLCNLPLLDKGIFLIVSFVVLFACILQVKSYLRKVDSAYVSTLYDFSKRNQSHAKKAGYVALHDLSFSWFRGVRMTVIQIGRAHV